MSEPAPWPATEGVPERVLAAERRREFQEMLSRSSLGCPLDPQCEHMGYQHVGDGYDRAARLINPRCAVEGCDCGQENSDG